MKIIFLLLLSYFIQAADGEKNFGTDVSSSFESKEAVESAIRKYADTFDSKDFKALKAVVTENFVTATGGEAFWKERLQKAKKNNRKGEVKNIKIVSRNNKIFVRFDTNEKMPKGYWIVMAQKNGKWLLDEPINDFDPE